VGEAGVGVVKRQRAQQKSSKKNKACLINYVSARVCPAPVRRLIAELREVALVAIDCNWNMAPANITAAAIALVKQVQGSLVHGAPPRVLAARACAFARCTLRATVCCRRAAQQLRAAFSVSPACGG